MRLRLFALPSVLALVLGGLLLAPASPASAAVVPFDPAHCSGWTTHPDLYNSGGISFANGTNLRTGPYTDCTSKGEGFPSQGINVHCARVNANGLLWLYVDDTSTGISGWGRSDAFDYSKSVIIPDCRD